MPNQGGTIADWTPTQLSRWLRDILENDPPRFFDTLSVNTLRVNTELDVKKAVEFTGQEFRSVGGTGQPAFKNSWTNFGSGWAAASFVRKPDDWVQLHGLVKNAANPLTLPSTIFTLPPGYWPEATILYPSMANNVIARVEIDPSGNVMAATPTSTAAPWVTLEGISFKVKPS